MVLHGPKGVHWTLLKGRDSLLYLPQQGTANSRVIQHLRVGQLARHHEAPGNPKDGCVFVACNTMPSSLRLALMAVGKTQASVYVLLSQQAVCATSSIRHVDSVKRHMLDLA